ncbi:hypothetical protein BASA81_000721 [Batrachochytrium salamandrivorans]|nr:hypothetical protein BASA81_000721 [Batrachochytrium salamandrivorans]
MDYGSHSDDEQAAVEGKALLLKALSFNDNDGGEEDEQEEVMTSSKPASRSPSFVKFLANAFAPSPQKPQSPEEIKLEALVGNSELKNKLISQLVLEDGETMVRLRFFAATTEILRRSDALDHENRRHKKQALAKIFFQPHGLVSMWGKLPEPICQDICNLKTSGIAKAHKLVGEDLLRHPLVALTITA